MFNKNNRNKKISIMFMLVFMLNILIGILPQDFFAYANNQTVTEAIYGSRDEPTVSESVYFIREIKLTDTEGNPLPEPVSKDSELRITYYFEIPNTMDLKEDEDFTITVPEEIQKINKDFLNHPLNDQDGNTIAYANFYVDNTVKVVFTDYVEQQGLGDIKGKFWVERRFESSKIGNEGETNIVFDLNGESTCEIKVEFETVPEETKVNISKTNSYSAKDNEITWTIEVEPGSSPTSNLPIEDVIITDLIENNQEYVSGSFNMDANIDGWDKDNEVIVTEPSGENRELKITFKYTINTNSNEVYTIKFKTKPDITAFTSEGESISFNNRANVKYKDIESGDVKEQEDTSTRKIKSNFISKVGKHNRETKKIEWTVTINNNYFNIPAGAKIEDIIPNGLTLDQNSIKLDDNSISIGGPLTYDDVEKELSYTFAAELNKPHKLTYITDVTDPDAYKSNTAKVYTNTATFIGTDIPGDASVGIGVRADTEVISKMGLNHYPSSHEIEWAIVINRNKIEIENPVVTDIIPDGLKYVEDSFTVNGIKTTDGLSYDKGNNTFIYDFTGKETDNKINDIYTLRFRTKVLDNKVYAVNGSKAFTNEVTLKGDNIPETTDTANKTYRSKVIEKTGIGYDYIDRIVTWQIVVNQNHMEMNNAYIEDFVPDGQAFVEDSVTINGDVVPEDGSKGNYTYDKNSKLLKYEFPTTINTEQVITFKTKITDLSIFETNGSINIENTAKLYGDDIPDNVESKGTQKINRVVVSKTGEYEKPPVLE